MEVPKAFKKMKVTRVYGDGRRETSTETHIKYSGIFGTALVGGIILVLLAIAGTVAIGVSGFLWTAFMLHRLKDGYEAFESFGVDTKPLKMAQRLTIVLLVLSSLAGMYMYFITKPDPFAPWENKKMFLFLLMMFTTSWLYYAFIKIKFARFFTMIRQAEVPSVFNKKRQLEFIVEEYLKKPVSFSITAFFVTLIVALLPILFGIISQNNRSINMMFSVEILFLIFAVLLPSF